MTIETPQPLAFGARELEGRIALVTGASRNIGRAIAITLADGGASVILTARHNRAALDEVVASIEAKGGRALAVLGNLTQPGDIDAIVAAGLSAFGGIDILVNNAALRGEVPIDELTLDGWRNVMALALDAPFLIVKAALGPLSRSGQGAIINIGGLTAYTGARHRVHVVAAKAGLDGLTKALAHELADRNITVNLVSPGLIETVRQGREPHHHATTANLAGRRGTPDDVAAMVRFLSGPQARYITGQTLHVNGGAYLP
jgi:3-oxoacyl-[acyl-carrier protein] reductase